MPDEQPKTVVFGLDGAHFELLEPWIAKGKLPNIKKAIETGVTGDLHSVLPPVTSPNWKSYATGKNPGKFGIFWWENIDVEERRIFYPHERKQRETEYWELLSENERPGIIGVPTTYPPKSIDEFMISGAPDASEEGFTYPESLEEYLIRNYNYKVTMENSLTATPDKAAKEILELIDTRFQVAKDLFEEYNLTFLQVTTFYINSLHHYFWDHDYTLQGWKIIDKHLGSFINNGHDVVLMSDHGSTEIETVFHVNSWLEKEGYLELDADTAEHMYQLGINRERILRILSTFGLQSITKFAPQLVLDLIPDEQGELRRESKTSNINWEETDAIASGQGPIYLTHEKGTKKYERLRKELSKKLESLKGPDGDTLAAGVHEGETIYSGKYVNEAPDLIMEQAAGVHIQGNIGRKMIFSEPEEDGWKGENKREGLFVATGPTFDSGEVKPLSILDLAPTLLHLRGHEIPRDMDGEVRTEIFSAESEPAQRDPSYREIGARALEEKRIRQVVRDLIVS